MSNPTLPSITTSTGVTVSLTIRDLTKIVILDDPSVLVEARHVEIGQVALDGRSFQPVPFFPAPMRPEVLRAIADLMEASHG